MAFGHLKARALASLAEKRRLGKIALAKARAAYHCYFCDSKQVKPFMIERTGNVVLLCNDCRNVVDSLRSW